MTSDLWVTSLAGMLYLDTSILTRLLSGGSCPPIARIRLHQQTANGLALLMSVYRMCYRAYTGWFGWDDAMCGVATCLMALQIAASMVFMNPPEHLRQASLVALYYINAATYESILYSVRISLTLTLIRIVARSTTRRWLYGLIGIFVFILSFLIVETVWICERDSSWKELQAPVCSLGRGRSVTELCIDCTSDVILVTIPICMILKMKLARFDRIRLMLIFSASLLITVAVSVQDVMVIITESIRGELSSLLANAFTLMVCNIAVIITSVYRLLKHRREHDSIDQGGETEYESPQQTELASTSLRVDIEWSTSSARAWFGSLSRFSTFVPDRRVLREDPRHSSHTRDVSGASTEPALDGTGPTTLQLPEDGSLRSRGGSMDASSLTDNKECEIDIP